MSKLEELLKEARLPWVQHGAWIGDGAKAVASCDMERPDAINRQHAELIHLAVNNIGPCVEALRIVRKRGCSCASALQDNWHSDKCAIPAVLKALAALDQK